MKLSDFKAWMRRESKLEVADVVEALEMSRTRLIDLRGGVRVATTDDLRHLLEKLKPDGELPIHADELREVLVAPVRRELELLAHVAGEIDRKASTSTRVSARRRAQG